MKNLYNKIIAFFIVVLLMVGSSLSTALADNTKLIMGRSYEAFPEAMRTLQEAIVQSGYTISMIQRVDIGLTGMGFKTDKYRVVFFGKKEEILNLPKRYPQLTPYLPLTIAIFAEDQETILTAMSPKFIANDFIKSKQDKDLEIILNRWHTDLVNIIKQVSETE